MQKSIPQINPQVRLILFRLLPIIISSVIALSGNAIKTKTYYTYYWFINDDIGRPTAPQIVLNGIPLIEAQGADGTPVSSFIQGGQEFQPAEFYDNYVPAVCTAPSTPICLMLVKFAGYSFPMTVLIIDGTYMPY